MIRQYKILKCTSFSLYILVLGASCSLHMAPYYYVDPSKEDRMGRICSTNGRGVKWIWKISWEAWHRFYGVDWIQRPQNKVQWQTIINTIKKFQVPYTADKVFITSETTILWKRILIYGHKTEYLFDMSELSIMRLSSSWPIVSAVVSPLRSSSPRLLNVWNVSSCTVHSLVTCLSLASMSFSFMAEIHISYEQRQDSQYQFRRYVI